MQVDKVLFKSCGDNRGQLIALEEFKEIPFSIKRVYYVYDTTQGVKRGCHAHKSLEQMLICIHGSCKILLDDGVEKETVLLSDPRVGLHVTNRIWREMFDFSPGAVLIVLASKLYDENDYIRDYVEFKKYVAAK
ncbi:MAG: dTDP-6-deoxy-3,4-keto-hexulose isomerase [Clostridiales bacterium 43-6]|jgi:dTDP-4-dehydrorhamnose 3,5-epimerase-like enzyme|nr:MAG: dTDP-6-deoxy-3,4-keto-hexulose isomerase [Clostridiales bacterium 43-6]